MTETCSDTMTIESFSFQNSLSFLLSDQDLRVKTQISPDSYQEEGFKSIILEDKEENKKPHIHYDIVFEYFTQEPTHKNLNSRDRITCAGPFCTKTACQIF
ncbi:hypothetical protein SteCoe_11632 [Stentor coeruleus]|uniref:Uncharacterized protein n=1 Tax=Stentor coeruleus TaxID=5963 RepID=A0A1R2CCN8_9CILI|nr:hypothetical protein SteCoe_11632 [Stentor coeruleus]